MKQEHEIKDEIRKLKKWMPKVNELQKRDFKKSIEILEWVLETDVLRSEVNNG